MIFPLCFIIFIVYGCSKKFGINHSYTLIVKRLSPRKRNRLLEEQYLNDRATLTGDGNWLWKTYVWYQLYNPTSFFWVTFWGVSSEKKSGARWPPFGESWKELVKKKVVFHSWIFWVIQVPKHRVSHTSRGETVFQVRVFWGKNTEPQEVTSHSKKPAAPGEWAQRSFHEEFFLLLFIGEKLKFFSSAFFWDILTQSGMSMVLSKWILTPV